jgi:hypothetical protein
MPGRLSERGQSVVEFALVVPLLLILVLAIVDLARIYTTMMSVESAAREAADYGTTLGAEKWQPGSTTDVTVAEMERRACTAARNLPDYAGAADGSTCTNPTFNHSLDPVGSTEPCENPDRAIPCEVTVTLDYNFRLLAPVSIDFLGVQVGFPATIPFQRDSTFAMTDIDLAGTAP